MAKENSVIDWEAYGTLLKAARLANGYSRGKKLTDAVEEKTGMKISERTIYALEDASRAPSADIFSRCSRCCPSCAIRSTCVRPSARPTSRSCSSRCPKEER